MSATIKAVDAAMAEEFAVVDDVAPTYIESADAFVLEEDAPEKYVVNELIPVGRTVLLHGEPRARKSWAALELAIAAATGTPAFGLDRFAVPSAVPVLHLSQEDGRRDVRSRLRRLLLGRGVEAPSEFFLAVHAGISVEAPEWQATLIRDVLAREIKLVIFDPIRRFSPNVDKGPSEVREVTAFLRRLTVETGATVATVHHDTKPSALSEDTRRRGHRASGGDWFAASDCPIHLEPAGTNRTLVVPEDFKHGTDPTSISFVIEEDEAHTWARLVAEDVAAADVASVGLHERILSFLINNPGSAGNAVSRGVRGGKAPILDALRSLEKAGKVDSVVEKRSVTWFVVGA